MADGIIGQLRDKRAALVPVEVKRINHTGSGNTEIVGNGNGQTIVVHGLEVTAKSAATVTLTTDFGSYHYPISPDFYLPAGGNLNLPFNPYGWMLGGETRNLGATITSATPVGVLAAITRVSNDLVTAVVSEGQAQWSAATVPFTAATADLALQVDRVNGTASDCSVDYATADITAAAGTNYTATNGTLTLDDGATSATINVPIMLDTVIAPVTFKVTLSNPQGGLALGTPTVCTVTINP